MSIDGFREDAHRMVDVMADYLDAVESYPVKSPVRPGQIADQLPHDPPEAAESLDDLLGDFGDIILPGITHWQHPSFFAYFPANSSPPSVLAEMLTATLGVQCMSWETSPAATELEERMMVWLRQMLGLPDGFTGSIQDTASTGTLCALLAARERVTSFASNEDGLSGTMPLTVYCSAETHSSIEKDVKITGVGRRWLRKIAVDGSGGMVVENLSRAISEDEAAGNVPSCVVATVGTTGSSAIDPVGEIAEVCRRKGLWLHVDAAWGGSAMILPEHRGMIAGVEHADSFVFNPHKWLFTNFDCSVLFVRDSESLVRTLAISPEYLKTRQDASVTNFRDWGIPLGRRFRALKLWFVIRLYGVDGLREKLRAHIAWAKELAADIDATSDFELLRAPRLSLLCFRYRPASLERGDELDRINEQLLNDLNDTGRLYVTHTRLEGEYAIRFAIGQTSTERRHVRNAWELIQETARNPGS